jgi:hypothetical protein
VKKVSFLLFSGVFWLPSSLRACAVCFGAESPDMAKGFYWGIILLLVLPPIMILGLVGLVAHSIRKHRRATPLHG